MTEIFYWIGPACFADRAALSIRRGKCYPRPALSSGAALNVDTTFDGKTQTPLKMLELSVDKPPVELFDIPSPCKATLKAMKGIQAEKQ